MPSAWTFLGNSRRFKTYKIKAAFAGIKPGNPLFTVRLIALTTLTGASVHVMPPNAFCLPVTVCVITRQNRQLSCQVEAATPRGRTHPEMVRILFSPRLICVTPSSQPRMTLPTPISVWKSPRPLDVSNLW